MPVADFRRQRRFFFPGVIEDMLEILPITGPIYITILIGYLATRYGLFAKADMIVIGKFTVNLALPGLIFHSLSEKQFGDILNTSYLAAYLAGSLTAAAVGYLWSRGIRRNEAVVATCDALGMSCSNSGFIGFPILLLFLAPIAAICLALNMIVENLIMLPLFLALAENSSGERMSWHRLYAQTFKRLSRNPLVIALLAGLLVSVSGIELPVIAKRTVNLFAVASGVLSLFFIGGTLVDVPIKKMGIRIATITIGKLIFHPLAVFLMITLLPVAGLAPLTPDMTHAAVIMAAVPMLSIYSILALKYGQAHVCSAAMLITTIVSFFTLSLLLWALKRFV